ncbi:MAG TPA: hypothetical protein PKY59_02345 [Pyrinomonadaceae bacterium]|nr:hypothetical protein [Pyrinomonadaceae bacterium]
MKTDPKGRLVLICRGTMQDLEKHNIEFVEGNKYIFYNDDEDNEGNRDDLVVEGIAQYDTQKNRWTAVINWNEIKNISELSVEEKKRLKLV